MDWTQKTVVLAVALATVLPGLAHGQDGQVVVDASPGGRRQVIDGFGTTLNERAGQAWYQALMLDDLRVSVVRMDMTPQFKAPYSDQNYFAPSFGGTIGFPGPDGNNVRTYTGPEDYGRQFGAVRAPIAVMGPDIDQNVKVFNFEHPRPGNAGAFARAAASRRAALGDFKLFASTFSPAPWLKVAAGNTISPRADSGPAAQDPSFPRDKTPFPFIWHQNFSGGQLDVSNRPLEVFNDGTGPTSALTQYARSTAAYIRGFQNASGVKLYALSIQNELTFEQFYDSCGYPLASQLGAALKVLRKELDKYPDLKDVKLIGPEDLLIDTEYSLWAFGNGKKDSPFVHKNLRYMHEMAASDPEALAAMSFFAVHGEPKEQAWRWWARGWDARPNGDLTIPATLAGFTKYNRKSWMTETSGSTANWPRPSESADSGALQVATNIHRALTAGEESAWVHWQLEDGSPGSIFALTDQAAGANAPKYVAAKHFFRNIRPNANRVEVDAAAAGGVLASAYVHDANRTITVVLINPGTSPRTTTVDVRGSSSANRIWTQVTSGPDALYQGGVPQVVGGKPQVAVPAYGVVTLTAFDLTK